jgi:hypothetical protein
MAIVVIICIISIPLTMAHQDGKNAWIWSVLTKDQLGETPNFYLPNEDVIVNWTINSSGENASIYDANLYTSSSDFKRYNAYWIPPKKPTELYENKTKISLERSQSENERTDHVEITAYAKTTDNVYKNETHIIEP